MMCYVSFCGPTNIPPLEAMSIGCPLICSNAYGMPSQIGKAGLLVNPSSHKDIASKIFIGNILVYMKKSVFVT